jgi:probable phosphoglycerate mutase
MRSDAQKSVLLTSGSRVRVLFGEVGGDEVLLKVHAGAGPFKVNSPTAGATVSGLTEVKWAVAKTDLSPINTQFVNISVSLDDGKTFVPVAVNTPNDGAEWIAVPNEASSGARIQVAAVENVFFAISPKFSTSAARSSIVVVRHAEKGARDDPDLNEAGKKRAEVLQQLLANAGISEVYSTNTQRTLQTAQPLASAAGLTITQYDSEEELATTLAAAQDGRRVLVVGHSNTIQPFLAKLGVAGPPAIGEEFDNLFVAISTGGVGPKLEQRKYSAVASPQLALRPAMAKGVRPTSVETKLQTIESQLQAIQVLLREIREGR